MLRPAQRFGLGGRIEERLRPVGPLQPPQRRFVFGGERAGCGGEQPAFALDHHPAHFAKARPDQRDPRLGIVPGEVADPFCARPGLAEPAPGTDQPDPPFAIGRQLCVARPAFPVPASQRRAFVRLQHLVEGKPCALAGLVVAAEPGAAGGAGLDSHRGLLRAARCSARCAARSSLARRASILALIVFIVATSSASVRRPFSRATVSR